MRVSHWHLGDCDRHFQHFLSLNTPDNSVFSLTCLAEGFCPPPPKKRKKILFLILKMFKRSLFERNTHNDFILFENSAAFRANEQIYYRSTKYRSGDLRTNLSKIVVKPKLMTQLLTKGDKEEGRGLSWQISVIFWQFEPLSSGRRYRAPIATKAAFRKSFIQSTINIRNLRKVPDEI